MSSAISSGAEFGSIVPRTTVSTTSVARSTPGIPTPPRAVQPRLRITARGRVVLTSLVAIPIIVTAIAVAINGGGAVATGSGTPLESVTVLAGQSMWQLAEELAPQADPREVIADLISLNTLASAEVQPGQQLDIPSQYSH